MIDWLRRVDPAFYRKEPHLLRTRAQIARYTDEAQAEVRLKVLARDRTLRAVTALAALSMYVVATGAGSLDLHRDWLRLWALTVLAVGTPCALPWWPRSNAGVTWRQALIGIALVAVSAIWTHPDSAVIVVALATGATLLVARGRARLVLLTLALAALFAARMPAHPPVVAALAGPLAAIVTLGVVRTIGSVWRIRPQVVTWSALATVLAIYAYSATFSAALVATHLSQEFVAITLAYLCICLMAGRIRRAELAARPDGVLSLPQSVVPLLDRSQHHAITCWLA